jgi:hypothetical protein|tara:strand:- start:7 stop:441 length:435 start_codon:yes stop_codon:yes gene_type:complete
MWKDILKRGKQKKLHHESLREAVITALEENTSNIPIFTAKGLVDVAHDIYWELATQAGHYNRNIGLDIKHRLSLSLGNILGGLGYTSHRYSRYEPRKGKFGVLIKKNMNFWAENDWEGLPKSARQTKEPLEAKLRGRNRFKLGE